MCLHAQGCRHAAQCRAAGITKPGECVSVAPLQFIKQLAAYLRELMHMLMAVDEVRPAAHKIFVAVQLARDLLLDPSRTQTPHPAAHDQCRYGKIKAGLTQRFSKVQVQPGLQAGTCAQCSGAGGKRWPQAQATGGIQPARSAQFQYSGIDGRIHAKIVGANHNTLLFNFGHALSPETITMQKLVRQLAWFIAVGCAAAATHWLVVVTAVSATGLAPLIANVIGWLVAFGVSFAGHYHLTFKHHRAPVAQAVRPFFAVWALAFAVN